MECFLFESVTGTYPVELVLRHRQPSSLVDDARLKHIFNPLHVHKALPSNPRYFLALHYFGTVVVADTSRGPSLTTNH